MFFNSLPLPHLDGSHLMDSVTDALRDESSDVAKSGLLDTLFNRVRLTQPAKIAVKLWSGHQRKIQAAIAIWTGVVTVLTFWNSVQNT